LSSINSLEHHDISNNYEKWGGRKKSLCNSLLQVFSLVATTAIGYTAIATSATAEISQQDHLIIAQFAPRGREFVCQFNGSGTTIAPNISGSFIHKITLLSLNLLLVVVNLFVSLMARVLRLHLIYQGLLFMIYIATFLPKEDNV